MNDDPRQQPRKSRKWVGIVGTLLVCLFILALAVIGLIVINRTQPSAERINATRKSAAIVETITVDRGTYAPRLVVLGTVEPARDIVLSPRVQGQVIEVSPAFVPGGMVAEGDLLVRIDPADFENALSISKSQLEQAEASREIEQARQRLAEKELELLQGSIDDTNRALVTREPQIASIEAEVAAAEAAVQRAELNLERTRVLAPFDAQILSCAVNVGSQVAAGDELGRLIGLEEFWIMAAVPIRSLRWLQFPDTMPEGSLDKLDSFGRSRPVGRMMGSRVILKNKDAWGPEVEREARVSRMIGTLDEQTRLARVLITVDDPLGQQSGEPPLILDMLLETQIEGRPIEDVIRLQREYVRDQDTVWVLEDGALAIREIDIVFRDARYAYIRTGLEDGDEVVITTLATVASGVPLRKVDSSSGTADWQPSNAEASE